MGRRPNFFSNPWWSIISFFVYLHNQKISNFTLLAMDPNINRAKIFHLTYLFALMMRWFGSQNLKTYVMKKWNIFEGEENIIIHVKKMKKSHAQLFEFLRHLLRLCQLQLMRKHSNGGGNTHMTQLWFIQDLYIFVYFTIF